MEMTKDILEMQHIQNNLARIDLILHREILRWRAAGQDPNDAFRGLYVTDEEVTALLERPMGSNWGELAELQTDLNQDFDASYDRIQQRIESVADKIRAGGSTPRLTHLQDSFHLLDIELDTVLLCLSAALDLRYERIFGFLQDDVTKKKPTVNLILNLLSNAQTPRHEELMIFFDQATLFRNRILHKGEEGNSGQQPLLNRPLSLNDTIVRWLIGDYQVPELLGIHAQYDPPSANKSLSLLAHPNESALKITNGAPPLIIFTGQDWTSQRSTALHLASRAQKPLLTINLQPLVEAGNPPMDLVEIGLRDARLNSAIPLFSGWDVVLKNDRAPGPLLERLYQFEDLIILCSLNPWLPGGPERLRELRTLNFSFPRYQKRLAIWDHFTDQMFSNQPDLLTLAGQFVLTVGQIRDAAATARDFAQQRGEALTIKDLFAAARAHSNPRLSSLARKIEPRFGWEDIVLPQDQITLLHEIVATVQERPASWMTGALDPNSRPAGV